MIDWLLGGLSTRCTGGSGRLGRWLACWFPTHIVHHGITAKREINGLKKEFGEARTVIPMWRKETRVRREQGQV